MKKIIIAVCAVFLVSCGPSKEQMDKAKAVASKAHPVGSIIWLKPDSTRVVITNIIFENACSCDGPPTTKYEVRDANGVTSVIPIAVIYPEVIE